MNHSTEMCRTFQKKERERENRVHIIWNVCYLKQYNCNLLGLNHPKWRKIYEITTTESQKMETNGRSSILRFIFFLLLYSLCAVNIEPSTLLRQRLHGAGHRFYFITFYDGEVSKSIRCKIMSPKPKCILYTPYRIRHNKYKLLPIF